MLAGMFMVLQEAVWESSATLALTGSLESKEALMSKGCLEKASLCHDHCTLGSQHSSLLCASFLDFSKNNQLHH